MRDSVLMQRWKTPEGVRWSVDGRWLDPQVDLGGWLRASPPQRHQWLERLGAAVGREAVLLPPVDPHHEIWASGVTYRRSRDARMAESETAASVYDLVYDAPRPELFFKALGHRVRGDGDAIRVRADSDWNVPEPELTLVVDPEGKIVGYTVGNDVSSRSIEGENPLYLPQAKIYEGSCAIGPGIVWLADGAAVGSMAVEMSIEREGREVYRGATDTGEIVRPLAELVRWLRAELAFPDGVLLMTGTGIVPGDGFTLGRGDRVMIRIGPLELTNTVA